jgi:site-specific DNA recombinase
MHTATSPPNPPVAARGYTRSLPPTTVHGTTARAVVYLRVSTASQVHTDRDAEGFSIPAQREACYRKAETLGATVSDEYTDAGESARKSDRPALQAMLNRLKTDGDIDYVIVHKVDRLARNRADDVTINLAIREAGARLVSVTENIDETPSGLLLHGIMASISEFYSKNLATEITKGMTQKAKKGMHPSLAPIGYLNTRENSDGHEIRTITVDPDRAPHVQWAFEAYASGEYTLNQLTDALAARGLTSRPTRQRPERPLVKRQVHRLLHNPFYIGIVTWGGQHYQGTHEPLIASELFARVEALLASRNQQGEKFRRHPHYLKSSIYCARCGSRLSFSRNRGNGGTYDYFFCLGRHQNRTNCTLPFLPAELVDQAVERYYTNIRLAEPFAEATRIKLWERLKQLHGNADVERNRQIRRIRRLEAKRRKLLDAHLAGAVPLDLLKEKQEAIAAELDAAQQALRRTEGDWQTIEDNLTWAMRRITDLHTAYHEADPTERRHFNQAFFHRINIDHTPGGVAVAGTELTKPYDLLWSPELAQLLDGDTSPTEDPSSLFYCRGLKESYLVEVSGLEPPASSLRTKRSSQLSYTPEREPSG